MKLYIKVLTTIFLCFALYVVWTEFQLPSVLSNGSAVFMDELANLPDADLRAEAEEFAARGDYTSAIGLLDYIIEQNLPDKFAAEQKREEYLQEIEKKDSPLGRLYRVAYGFGTGRVEDVESLLGSTAGDLFLWGDIRDLVNQVVFEDKTDPLIVTLSAIGVGITVFPQADVVASLAKAARKCGAFSISMMEIFKKFSSSMKFTEIVKLEKFREIFMPIYELCKNSKTWTHFTSMLRACNNIVHVKTLTKISASAPKNAEALGQIFAAAFKLGPVKGTQIIEFFNNYGQKGLERMHQVLRKGARGIDMLLRNPWAGKGTITKGVLTMTKSMKLLEKAFPLPMKYAKELILKYPMMARFAKYSLFGCIVLSIIGTWGGLLKNFRQKPRDKADDILARSPSAGIKISFILIALVLSASGLLAFFTPNIPVDTALAENYGHYVEDSNTANTFSFRLLITLTVVISILLFIYHKLYRRTEILVKQILAKKISSNEKLTLLKNLDIYFDLPLYIGLGVTILGFIIITLGGLVEARAIAYTATLLGIISAVLMRLKLLKPAQDTLVETKEYREAIKDNSATNNEF